MIFNRIPLDFAKDAPRSVIVPFRRPKFTTRARLGVADPPTREPPTKVFGEYCWRATCFAYNDDGMRVAAFMGYDMMTTIGEETRGACRRHAPRDTLCGDADLVLLPSARKECSGQVFFVLKDGSSKRVV